MDNLQSFTVAQLKVKLTELNLPTNGRKADLINRLQEAQTKTETKPAKNEQAAKVPAKALEKSEPVKGLNGEKKNETNSDFELQKKNRMERFGELQTTQSKVKESKVKETKTESKEKPKDGMNKKEEKAKKESEKKQERELKRHQKFEQETGVIDREAAEFEEKKRKRMERFGIKSD